MRVVVGPAGWGVERLDFRASGDLDRRRGAVVARPECVALRLGHRSVIGNHPAVRERFARLGCSNLLVVFGSQWRR